MKKTNGYQYVYTIAMIIISVKNILDTSELMKRPSWFDNLLLVAFLGCIGFKFCTQHFSLLKIILFLVTGVMVIYTCIHLNYFYLLITFLAMVSIQDVKLEEVIKQTARVKGVLLIIHIVYYFSLLVISPGSLSYSYRNGVKRHVFFMGHPNTFSMYVLWTTIEFLYAHHKKMKSYHIVLFWLINAITYYFTNSNTGIIVSTVTSILLYGYQKNSTKIMKIAHKGSRYCFLACSIIFPLISVCYVKLSGSAVELINKLDDILTGRIMYGAYTYDVFGFTLLGRTITVPEKIYWRGVWFDGVVYDNAYIWLFVIYGSIYLVIFSIGFILISNQTTNMEKILIIAFAMYGIMEGYIVNASICFPLLYLGKYLYQRKPGSTLKDRGI